MHYSIVRSERQILGVPISAERENDLRQRAARRTMTAAGRKERKKKLAEAAEVDEYPNSDETFAFIAGYTPAGFAYGTTWEGVEETPPWLDEEESEQEPACDFKKAVRRADELLS